MALDIDGDGKSRDVGGGDLAGDAERGHVAAEPLRPDIQGVDLLERLFLDGGDILAGGQGREPAVRTVSTMASMMPLRPSDGVSI